ncbi:MAG: ABC transporter ATP-binding protein [Elusimicrobia bacterium]|nr:ABC transporter ATP-binding protein [Elusimicrobiota bacterium]
MQKAIEIKNLNFSYPDGRKSISDFSLDVFEGETVGIIGPNGAGKTTLLLHLNGILGDNSKIEIFGIPINKKNIREIRRRVGLVFQNPDDQLFMPTVFDDVAFGPQNLGVSEMEIKKGVINCLNSVGLSGYESRISHHLSFGEKKRVAIASVLIINPDILVLDEPTSNLDPATRREFVKLIKNFNHTKIIAGHDMEMVKEICNRVVIVNRGSKITEGPPIQIFTDKELLLTNRLM